MDQPYDYEGYKKDTAYVVRWILTTFNRILKANPLHQGIDLSALSPDDEQPSFNRTGKAQCRELLSKVRYISRYLDTRAPGDILRRLRSAIKLREDAHAHFEKLAKMNRHYTKGNRGHREFILVLQQIFELLGGSQWLLRDASEPDVTEQDAMDRLLNRFDRLYVEHVKDVEEDQKQDEDGAAADGKADQAQRKRKGKPGKKKAKPKKQQQPPEPEMDPVEVLDNLPLEKFEILQDEDGRATDLLIAVHGLVQECIDVRRYIQDVWHDVAYDELNSAVAGALTNTALAAVKKRQLKLAAEFPETAHFEAVNEAVAGGEISNVQGKFGIPYQKDGEQKWAEIDVTEQFMVHAHRDLVDFVIDYRLNRTGKPTKRMQKEIGRWDPNVDLGAATSEDRLRWRRQYTINWLYELVRLYTYPVVQRIAQGEDHKLDEVDWSPDGPWGSHHRLFGLNEFATFVSTLATQKPGAPIAQRIGHHHVLQLQFLVDSYAAMRGWTTHILRGHVLETPTAGFEAMRDIDLFLDRDEERNLQGFLPGFDAARSELQVPNRAGVCDHIFTVMDNIADDFTNWLGSADGLDEVLGIAPARFSYSDGLWRYSPMLCGVGLEEALEQTALLGRMFWDSAVQPMLLVHLYNMLVQEGYLEPIDLFARVLEMYPSAFFADGEIAKRDFLDALLKRAGASALGQLREKLQGGHKLDHDLMIKKQYLRMLKARPLSVFEADPLLVACRAADWDPTQIPEKDLDNPSYMGLDALRRTPRERDSYTGNERFEDTELVKRARARNSFRPGTFDENAVAKMVSRVNTPYRRSEDTMRAGLRAITDRDTPASAHNEEDPAEVPPALLPVWPLRQYLDMLKVDLNNDVCGAPYPRSGFNYLSALVPVLNVVDYIGDRLVRARHSIYLASTTPGSEDVDVVLMFAYLLEADEQCLKMVAEVFEDFDRSYWEFNYWDVVERHDRCGAARRKKWSDDLPPEPETCVVM